MSTQNLLLKYPHAKATRLSGLYRIGKDYFLIQVKKDFDGEVVGFQTEMRGSFREAVAFWKSARAECLQRAKEKRRKKALERFVAARLGVFK